jgi:D-3-phosphoglycerate dehydrogenase / 2-oxoglutarate reductase
MDRNPYEATISALILDLLEWIGPRERPYVEVMSAWRTSCPRLPVWEEANERGFIELRHGSELGTTVTVSAVGAMYLRTSRPDSAAFGRQMDQLA